MEEKKIQDLPEEIFEYILSLLSPYDDLKNCMLVCREWRRHVRDVVWRMKQDFHRALSEMTIEWHCFTPDPGPTISKRFSHSACCYGNSMYVFGGCITTNTTVNDLWRLDLGTREWIRPLAMGTYPSPKACASLVCYKDSLILFGGWTLPSPYPLHQVCRIFNQLHIYSPLQNRWNQLVSPTPPPAMAGHSATVHENKMIVFGGLQRQNSGRPYASSNDVWIFDLETLNWKKQDTAEPRPSPRYGQSQIYIDDEHALIIGGCGGPNMLLYDMWMLTMPSDSSATWYWSVITVKNLEFSAPHIWCHPACKVGDKVVVVSHGQQSKTSPTSLRNQFLRPNISMVRVPPREDDFLSTHQPDLSDNRLASPSTSNDNHDLCVNGRRGTFRRPSDPPSESRLSSPMGRQQTARTNPVLAEVGNSGSWSSNNSGALQSRTPYSKRGATETDQRTRTSSPVGGSSSHRPDMAVGAFIGPSPTNFPISPPSQPIHNTPMPSIRPNPMSNRQRQLESLRRMEERILHYSRKHSTHSEQSAGTSSQQAAANASSAKVKTSTSKTAVHNPMLVYTLDIKGIVETKNVSWLSPHRQLPSTGPEDTILYSLVCGRGELIMFGGVQKDPNVSGGFGGIIPNAVSNTVHFISPQKWVI